MHQSSGQSRRTTTTPTTTRVAAVELHEITFRASDLKVIKTRKVDTLFRSVTKNKTSVETVSNFLRERPEGKRNVAIFSKGKAGALAELATLRAGGKVITPGKATSAHARPYVTRPRSLAAIAARLYNQDARVIFVSTPKELKAALKIASGKFKTPAGSRQKFSPHIEQIITLGEMKLPEGFAEHAKLVKSLAEIKRDTLQKQGKLRSAGIQQGVDRSDRISSKGAYRGRILRPGIQPEISALQNGQATHRTWSATPRAEARMLKPQARLEPSVVARETLEALRTGLTIEPLDTAEMFEPEAIEIAERTGEHREQTTRQTFDRGEADSETEAHQELQALRAEIETLRARPEASLSQLKNFSLTDRDSSLAKDIVDAERAGLESSKEFEPSISRGAAFTGHDLDPRYIEPEEEQQPPLLQFSSSRGRLLRQAA